MNKDELKKMEEEALRQIREAENMSKLNEIRIAFLGKKGQFTNAMK